MYLDSLRTGKVGKALVEKVFRYLQREHVERYGNRMNTDNWILTAQTRKIARQRDGYQCGVYVCMYAMMISMECDIGDITEVEIQQMRRKIILSILQGNISIKW